MAFTKGGTLACRERTHAIGISDPLELVKHHYPHLSGRKLKSKVAMLMTDAFNGLTPLGDVNARYKVTIEKQQCYDMYPGLERVPPIDGGGTHHELTQSESGGSGDGMQQPAAKKSRIL
jgi:hypothetical protein